jgi:glycine betaine/proline transport system substrate-binding protein
VIAVGVLVGSQNGAAAEAGGDPEQYKCEYDTTVIEKLFSKKFADSGSPRLQRAEEDESLTNEEQEQVAKAIAGDTEDPEQAGRDWVADSRDKVDAWLGEH